MKKSIKISAVAIIAVLSQGVFADGWGSVNLHEKVKLDLVADDLMLLSVDVAAGELEIIGQQESSQIAVTAKIFGEDVEDSDYQLSLEKSGDQAILVARFLNNTYNNERIDVVVSMPASLALQVDDRSGDIIIEGVQSGLTLNDRSGDIELSDIAGNIVIVDRSGDLEAKNLRGNVSIKDRSGDILVKQVEGDLNIEDSSGDIRAKNVNGVVTVADSSGDINVNSANDFILKDDSSGELYLKNIKSR